MSYLTRDQILEVKDLDTREVEVPEWGGTVLVRALSGKERDAWEASLANIRDGKSVPDLTNTRAKLVARAIVDEDGKRVFTDLDVKSLGEKSAAALNRVFEIASNLSGLSPESIEEISGNSDAAPGGASSSDSPATSEE